MGNVVGFVANFTSFPAVQKL